MSKLKISSNKSPLKPVKKETKIYKNSKGISTFLQKRLTKNCMGVGQLSIVHMLNYMNHSNPVTITLDISFKHK